MPIRAENRHRYPADWERRSRFVRHYRARNRCEWCGAANGQPHPVTGSKVVLTCAHVYYHDPAIAALWNLAALCQLCHNRHDAKHRAAGRRQQHWRRLRHSTIRPLASLCHRRQPQRDYPTTPSQRHICRERSGGALRGWADATDPLFGVEDWIADLYYPLPMVVPPVFITCELVVNS